MRMKNFNVNQDYSLNELLTKNENADVTLITVDKAAFPAHKFVLSACSPVLKDLLLNNPHPHPIIYLNSIRGLELDSLLQFIYLGKTQIHQIEIGKFYENVRDLQIKLLNQPLIDDDDELNDVKNDCLMIGNFGDNMTVEESNPRLIEEDDFMKTFSCQKCEAEAFNSLLDLRIHIKKKHESTMYNCGICPYKTSKPSNLKQHKESIHEGVRYSCDICKYEATTKGCLKKHKESIHEGVRYACDSCEYYATHMSNLKSHIRAKHEGVKYSCDWCKFKTGWKKPLAIHKKTMHC